MNPHKGIVYKSEKGWKTLDSELMKLQPSTIFVIVDENTKTHCVSILRQNINQDFQILTIPAGEAHKNIFTCLKVWEDLSQKGADRKSLILNLGGGVVTDLGGFVAATFNRGIRFINIPTTLLAMVDASVGGKNGIDLGSVKNQIGTVVLPEMVMVETAFLQTLPKRELLSGFAEMLKHSLVDGNDSWQNIKNTNLNDKTALEELIWESIEIKNRIVSQDPFEANVRKTLNFGHTLGHAIESYCLRSNRTSLLHGEAIAIGMILAAYISNQLLDFPKSKMMDVCNEIVSIFPKQEFLQNEIQEILKLMIFDKKNSHGQVLFVLIEDFGVLKTNCMVDNNLIYRAFEFYENI